MKGRFWRKAVAACLALLLVTGNVPIQPVADLFGNMAITANAETSTINVDGTDYTLFTSFTATGGSTGMGVFTYDKAVDGDMSSSWHDMSNGVYVEFNSDDPIIPKGYIFNTYMAGNFYPEDWVLKAKANTDDDWITLSSYSGQTLSSGQEFQYACSNDDNTAYKYFRFEASNTNNNIWLTEIRLYGFENLTYTHLTETTATCTEVGIKQECYRRSDGKYFTDETGATELAESDVIEPMIAHTGVHHAADEDHIEYWQCSMCGKYFSDSDCSAEITEAQTQALRYLDENGDTQTLDTDKTIVTSATKSWSNGWYVVYDDVTISDRITVSGTVNLILCNGATLTASKGITVGSNNTLNIYAQTDDEATMGTLVADATSETDCAGIGGVSNAHPNCGTIVINGGKITANGNEAGIGGGGYQSTNGNITINGGIVNATAGSYSNSAGIGGGNNGYVASVTLNGGIITATGDTHYGGAGIGTGSYGGNGTMTITIGSGVKKLVTTKGKNSECIGKETHASTTVNVVFKDGNTTVTGDVKDAVFYDTGEGSERQIRTKALNHVVTMSDDVKANITANTEYALAGETITLTLGAAVDASTLKVNDGANDLMLTDAGNRQYTFTMPDGDVTVTSDVAEAYSVTLPDHMVIVGATNAADSNGKYISGTVVTFKQEFGYSASDVSDGANTLEPDANGIYTVTVADTDVSITATIGRSDTIDLSDVSNDFTAVDGDALTGSTSNTVNIADGASITLSNVTINGGIVCEGTATVTLVGTNSTTGKYGKAGIQIGGSGTTLIINGDGSLTATGGYDAAGIGLNRAFNVTEDVVGGNIVIEGGNITANGGGGGAGIGAGVTKDTYNSSSRKAIVGNITISGGSVTAVGGTNADGIGAGENNYHATIQIGTVTIYDGIDKVDASSIKDFANVVYMHGESNVTASKTDYFTIGEDSNRRLIVQKPVIAEIAEQAYTGSAVTPEPQVTIGSLNLTKGTDYEYSYTDNTNAGTATVTVTFKGDYASLGSVEKTFAIVRNIYISDGIEHGSITPDSYFANEGDTVPLTITPDDGYAVKSVKYNDGTDHVITPVEDVYSFTMPESNVTVSAEYTKLPYVNVNVTGGGSVTYDDNSAADSGSFEVITEKGAEIPLILTPDSGYNVKSVEYGYTNSKGTNMSGRKLPISDGTATLTVPTDLKDGTGVTITVTFSDALVGGADESSAVALTDNTVTDLAGGWYKVESDITFDHTLNLLGDTHLVIADGKTMTVNTASGNGIDSDYTLTVSGEGALSVTASGSYPIAICVGSYVQTGVTVTASGFIGIRCHDDFDADVTNDFTFRGGQLTATGTSNGIWVDNNITLGYTNGSDFIQASNYHGIIVADDSKMFTDGTDEYSGTLSDNAIKGKKLSPVSKTLTLPTSIANGTLTADQSGNVLVGDTVTLTVTPDEGYVLKFLTVMQGETAVAVENNQFTMPAEDVTVSAEFARVYEDGIGEHLAGHSLSLTGNIGVNFYMELDADVIADTDAYMHFTLPNGKTQDVTIAQATTKTISGKTYYVFQCEVAAKEMTDKITAQMFSGTKTGKKYEYTVKQYADYLFENAYEADGTTVKNQEYVDAIALIESMVNYGAYSQIYFNHNTDALANADITNTDVSSVTAETVNKPYDSSTANLPNGVTFAGANLELESETVLNLYFSNTTGKALTFTTSGNVTLAQKPDSGYTKVTITGIAAQNLDDDVTVNVAVDGDNSAYSVKYSPMNYCYNTLSRGTTATRTEALKNVMRAFYLYNQEAKAYFATHNN